MKMLSFLTNSILLKLAPLRSRIKKRTDRQQMEQRLGVKIRDKVLKSMEIRPRNEKDYYPLGRWLVSKRLVTALIVVAGVFSLVYVSMMLPEDLLGSRQYRTYKYNAIPLKYYKGTVEILGKSGYTAYIGAVKGGVAQGEGTLYRLDGSMVYEGAFSQSMFHGIGKLFYPAGFLKYEGTFQKNRFSGEGKLYRSSGTLEYAGNFEKGLKQGEGELYNEAEQKIYAGTFGQGNINYETFLGKTTAEVSSIYSGKRIVYSFEKQIGTVMDEINAIYVACQEEGSLEEEWKVSGVYILSNVFRQGEQEMQAQQELEAYFGPPVYEGTTAVTWADTAALYSLSKIKESFGKPPAMESTAEFEDVIQIEGFDNSYEVYIRAYEREGYRYLFFSPEQSEVFSFYLIEPEEEGTG